MAEQAVKKEIVKKPIKYKRNDNSEEENLKSLAESGSSSLQANNTVTRNPPHGGQSAVW